MIRQLVKDSKTFILQKPKLVRLAFLIGLSRSVEILLLLAYNINNILIYRAGKGMSVLTMFQYFIDEIEANHIVRLIVIIIVLLTIGYVFLYPMGISAIIHFFNQKKENISKAIGKGAGDFFTMFELNALAFSFGPYTYIITTLRLITLDVINSGFVIGLLILWGTIVLLASMFWQYAKFIIVEEQIGVFEAIKKSVSLSINNMGITIKGLIMKLLITILFYFKMIVIAGIPILIAYFLIKMQIINGSGEGIIRTLGIIAIILASYTLTTIYAFFMTFWHKIYKHILAKDDNDD